MRCREFAKLVDLFELGDLLLVTKLDRLGRNARDLRTTVERIADEAVNMYGLVLGA